MGYTGNYIGEVSVYGSTTPFQQSYCIPGTLTANILIIYKVPFECQLVHVSAVATNDSDATLKIGTTTNDSAYLSNTTIGDSSVPKEFEQADFVGGDYPTIPDGTTMKITLDYDGTSGTAAANVTIVLTFMHG